MTKMVDCENVSMTSLLASTIGTSSATPRVAPADRRNSMTTSLADRELTAVVAVQLSLRSGAASHQGTRMHRRTTQHSRASDVGSLMGGIESATVAPQRDCPPRQQRWCCPQPHLQAPGKEDSRSRTHQQQYHDDHRSIAAIKIIDEALNLIAEDEDDDWF